MTLDRIPAFNHKVTPVVIQPPHMQDELNTKTCSGIKGLQYKGKIPHQVPCSFQRSCDKFIYTFNLALVRRHAWSMPDTVRKIVIQALVLLVIDYCSPVLACVLESCCKMFQVIQNKAFRLALKCSFDIPVS